MKKLILILFVAPLFCYSQSNVRIIPNSYSQFSFGASPKRYIMVDSFNGITYIIDIPDTVCLPVKFLDFRINKSANQVKATFQTGEEIGNHHFELERSFDGIYFQEVSTIKPNSTHTYIIYTELEQDSYYRIRQVDLDGRYSLSKTIFIKKEQDKDLNAFFAGNSISINIKVKANNPYIFAVNNMSGQEVLLHYDTLFKGINYLKFDASNLPYGNYVISVFENSRLIKTLKLKK